MTRHISESMIIMLGTLLVGCATFSIDNPQNGAAGVTVPLDVRSTANGPVTVGDVYLDNENLSRFNNSKWQFTPRFWLTYTPLGSHALYIAAENDKTHQNLGQTAGFTVSACPLCYSCPTGSRVHPITGQCCSNNICDVFLAGNSGVNRFNSTECQKALAPGSSEYYYERGCISSQTWVVRGATANLAAPLNGPEMSAVRFVVNQTGALTQIRVPIGVQSGPGNVRVWITPDAGGRPGTAPLETIVVQNIRSQILPITSPISIFSVARPILTAGTTYWLVIGPGNPATVVHWNVSLDDFSIPNTTTYMVNRTTSDLTGPWVMQNNLTVLVPAYEISIRQ